MFVDHSFDFNYVHLMSKLNAEAKVEAKLEFERICYSYGVKSLRYHADNGLFDTNKFKEACNVSKRTLSFCGVNDHHQNGKPKNIVKDVTTGESTALLHSDHFWINEIHASLWPGAIKSYVNQRHSIPANFKSEIYHRGNKIPATYDYSALA